MNIALDKATGITLEQWKVLVREKKPEALVALLKEYGLAKDLWIYLACSYRDWEFTQNLNNLNNKRKEQE